MKILVREIENGVCNYVWKKLRKDHPFSDYGDAYLVDNGKRYEKMDVLKISGDYRRSKIKYVICGACGKMVKENEIEKHYREEEANANCMKCDKLYLSAIKDTQKNIMLKNGNVLSKVHNEAFCRTSRYGSATRLADVDRVSQCKYYRCRRSETRNLPEDFFSRYPNPYKRLLTEKKIMNTGWKYFEGGNNCRSYCNTNGKIIASCDTNGILMYFILLYRDRQYKFYYSDVYDIFVNSYGEIFNWSELSAATKEKYMRQIRKLYM